MNLLGTCQDCINYNFVTFSNTEQSGNILTRKIGFHIKENLDINSADIDIIIVPQEIIKSKAFNNPTASYKKDWYRRMGYKYGKMSP